MIRCTVASYFVTHKNETTFAETMMLENTKGKMTYTVTTKNQNNELPVRFTLPKAVRRNLCLKIRNTISPQRLPTRW
jgi:hypothetical protein